MNIGELRKIIDKCSDKDEIIVGTYGRHDTIRVLDAESCFLIKANSTYCRAVKLIVL